MDKTRCITSEVMFVELGDYDPSNEYIVNNSDAKTIQLNQKLRENQIDVEMLYQKIHNQLNKKDKLKCTKLSNYT